MCTLLPAEKLHNQSVRWSLRAGLQLYFRLLIENVFFTDMEALIINKLEDECIFSFTILYSAPSLLLGTVYGSFCFFVFFFFFAMSRATTQSSIY